MREIKLPSGQRLRVRPVPAYALMQVGADVEMPEEPVETVKTAVGEETVRALPGSPAYQEYRKQIARAMREQEQRRLAFVISYGVVAWEHNGKWESDVPDGWELDGMLAPYSVGDRRADYILSSVLISVDDLNAAVEQIVGQVNEREVRAAQKLFRGPTQ